SRSRVRRPPPLTLFPYTTLFRSDPRDPARAVAPGAHREHRRRADPHPARRRARGPGAAAALRPQGRLTSMRSERSESAPWRGRPAIDLLRDNHRTRRLLPAAAGALIAVGVGQLADLITFTTMVRAHRLAP